MIQVLYYGCILLIVFLIGFSFVVLSKEIQGKWIPKSFLIGAAVLMLATFWISNLNKGGVAICFKYSNCHISSNSSCYTC